VSAVLPRTEAARGAIRRGHVRRTTVELWYPSGKQIDLPFEAGEVSFSLATQNGNRSGRLTLPGYEWYSICDPVHNCWVDIWVEIEDERFHIGELPIVRCGVDRPRGTTELTLGDWAYRRAQPMAESDGPIGATNQTIASVVQSYLSDVLPYGLTVTRDDSNGALVPSPEPLSFGGNVYATLTGLCNQVGCTLHVPARTQAQIRRFDPYAPYMEDLTGTVVREGLSTNADQLVNRVMVRVNGGSFSTTQTDENGNPVFNKSGASYTSEPHVAVLTTGPYAYDSNGMGEMTYTETKTVEVATQAIANAEAQRVFDRKVGIVRTTSVDVVPTPWLRLGDIVAWYPKALDGTPVIGMINAHTFPLTADGVHRITLRDSQIA
jgi:hypothetical protein